MTNITHLKGTEKNFLQFFDELNENLDPNSTDFDPTSTIFIGDRMNFRVAFDFFPADLYTYDDEED